MTDDNFENTLKQFEENITARGYNGFMFTQMDTNSSPAIFSVKYFYCTYPNVWQKRYLDKRYLFSDPIGQKIMSNQGPFFWSQYLQTQDISDDNKLMMTDAMANGLVDGIGCSYLKNKGNLYTLAVSKTQPYERYDEGELADIYLRGARLVSAYEAAHDSCERNVIATDREREIVTYAAIGKTDSEIATLLKISQNTIRYHWKNIFQKLDCYGRVFAIIRAMNMGWVRLDQFNIPTEDGSGQVYYKSA